jgi:hypothetical protein
MSLSSILLVYLTLLCPSSGGFQLSGSGLRCALGALAAEPKAKGLQIFDLFNLACFLSHQLGSEMAKVVEATLATLPPAVLLGGC